MHRGFCRIQRKERCSTHTTLLSPVNSLPVMHFSGTTDPEGTGNWESVVTWLQFRGSPVHSSSSKGVKLGLRALIWSVMWSLICLTACLTYRSHAELQFCKKYCLYDPTLLDESPAAGERTMTLELTLGSWFPINSLTPGNENHIPDVKWELLSTSHSILYKQSDLLLVITKYSHTGLVLRNSPDLLLSANLLS